MKIALFAPVGYWNLSDAGKREICNGCGAKSILDFVPDTVWGLDISEACNIHDYCYAMAEPRIEAKAEADRIFLNNMLRIVEAGSRNGFMRRLRRSRAYTYYRAVSWFGGPCFWNGKNKEVEARYVAINC